MPPTGALLGLDAVRAAAEGEIRSIKMITRKPPGGLEGAPYLVEHKISVAGLKAPLKVFDGTAREGARGFPANVNVAAALSLAGIVAGSHATGNLADPALNLQHSTASSTRPTSRVFTWRPSKACRHRPIRTGRIVPLSTIVALRALVSELKVGT